MTAEIQGMFVAQGQLKENLEHTPLCAEVHLVARLQRLVEKHYLKEKCLDFYCKQLGVTYYYLNRLTGFYLEKTVYQILQERLLAQCKVLLINTLMSRKTLAFELGFSDPANFVRFFRRHTGMTPAKFRALSRKLDFTEINPRAGVPMGFSKTEK